jgi:hypothetical protein
MIETKLLADVFGDCFLILPVQWYNGENDARNRRPEGTGKRTERSVKLKRQLLTGPKTLSAPGLHPELLETKRDVSRKYCAGIAISIYRENKGSRAPGGVDIHE